MNGAVNIAHTERSVGNASLSAASIVAETYLIFWRHRRDLLRAISFPAALAGIILGATLQSYYFLLGGFLAAPSPRSAGVVFAILIAGVLAWVFVAALLASAGAEVAADDHEGPGRFDIKKGLVRARLFSASLRFVFLLFAIATIATTLIARADMVHAPGWVAVLLGVIALGVGAIVCVRAGFLLPALARHERQAVLRRSLQLSRGHFWRLMVIWIALVAAPAIVIFSLGELALGGWLAPDHLPSFGSTARAASALAHDYAGIPAAILLTVITTICLTLAGIGSHVAYRQFTDQSY